MIKQLGVWDDIKKAADLATTGIGYWADLAGKNLNTMWSNAKLKAAKAGDNLKDAWTGASARLQRAGNSDYMRYVVPAAVGALTTGTAAAFLPDLFWKKPTAFQRIISILAGAGAGGLAGAGIASAFTKDKKLTIEDKLKNVTQHAKGVGESLLGGVPTVLEAANMSNPLLAWNGVQPNNASTLLKVIAATSRNVKRAIPWSTDAEDYQNVGSITTAGVGGLLSHHFLSDIARNKYFKKLYLSLLLTLAKEHSSSPSSQALKTAISDLQATGVVNTTKLRKVLLNIKKLPDLPAGGAAIDPSQLRGLKGLKNTYWTPKGFHPFRRAGRFAVGAIPSGILANLWLRTNDNYNAKLKALQLRIRSN